MLSEEQTGTETEESSMKWIELTGYQDERTMKGTMKKKDVGEREFPHHTLLHPPTTSPGRGLNTEDKEG